MSFEESHKGSTRNPFIAAEIRKKSLTPQTSNSDFVTVSDSQLSGEFAPLFQSRTIIKI